MKNKISFFLIVIIAIGGTIGLYYAKEKNYTPEIIETRKNKDLTNYAPYTQLSPKDKDNMFSHRTIKTKKYKEEIKIKKYIPNNNTPKKISIEEKLNREMAQAIKDVD